MRMTLDRFVILSAIDFIAPAIPKGSESGKNCLFIRVDGDKMILTGGGLFVTKKVVIQAENTIQAFKDSGNKNAGSKTFMIPRADVFAFKKMMEEHKADCKKLAKNDPSYLHVEVGDAELLSHDAKIVYEQPKYEFKDLESVFQIVKGSVSEIPLISADIISSMTGFKKSDQVEVTFTGPRNLIHFQQGDYEATVLPPVEKEEEDTGEQMKIDDNQGEN